MPHNTPCHCRPFAGCCVPSVLLPIRPFPTEITGKYFSIYFHHSESPSCFCSVNNPKMPASPHRGIYVYACVYVFFPYGGRTAAGWQVRGFFLTHPGGKAGSYRQISGYPVSWALAQLTEHWGTNSRSLVSPLEPTSPHNIFPSLREFPSYFRCVNNDKSLISFAFPAYTVPHSIRMEHQLLCLSRNLKAIVHHVTVM